MQIMDGRRIKEKKLLLLKEKITLLDRSPSLVVIQVGDDPASNIYINQKRKMANQVGIEFEHKKYLVDITEKELIKEISKLNKDLKIDAILVQLPLPKHLDQVKILNEIDPSKDVDCLTEINLSRLATRNYNRIPCTPSGILTLLEEYNVSIQDKKVVVLGRSNLVGKPIAMLLEERGAEIVMCHSKTEDIHRFTKLADILISAVGKKHMITKEDVKENAVIIDVGINDENNILYGDVDFDNVKEKVSLITPVPGGVGPMTVLSLAENTYDVYLQKKRELNEEK